MKLLRSLLVFYLVNLSSVCYSQVDIYTINLHGDKKKGTLESFIKIPVDSLNNLMLNSIKGISWEPVYEGLLINKVLLNVKSYMLYDSILLQSGFLRVLSFDQKYTRSMSDAHDKVFSVVKQQLNFPLKQLTIVYTFIILQHEPDIKKDSILISDENKWGFKSLTVLINPDLNQRKSKE